MAPLNIITTIKCQIQAEETPVETEFLLHHWKYFGFSLIIITLFLTMWKVKVQCNFCFLRIFQGKLETKI